MNPPLKKFSWTSILRFPNIVLFCFFGDQLISNTGYISRILLGNRVFLNIFPSERCNNLILALRETGSDEALVWEIIGKVGSGGPWSLDFGGSQHKCASTFRNLNIQTRANYFEVFHAA